MIVLLWAALQETHLIEATTPEGVALRWFFGKQNLPANGVDVYRKSDGDYSKISAQPIRKMTKAEIEKNFDPELIGMVWSLLKDVKDPLSQEGQMRDFALGMTCELNVDAAKIAGLYYHDTTAKKGTRYTYQLRQGDKILATSKEIEAGGQPNIPAPGKPEVMAVGEQVGIVWQKVPKITGYHIYRSAPGGKLERISERAIAVFDPPKNAQGPQAADGKGRFKDTNVQVRQTYSYAVVSLDSFGRESQPSEPVSIELKDKQAPGIPAEVKAEVIENQMTVTWKAASDPDTKGYNVYRARTIEDKPEKINKELVTETRFVDTSVKKGGYVYSISSIDKEGNESTPSVPTFGQFIDKIPPGKIKDLIAKPEVGKVTLTWTAAAEDDVEVYFVCRKTSNGEWPVIATAKGTTFVDTVAVNHRGALVYRVKAVDTSNNEGEASQVETHVPDVTAPAAPTLEAVDSQNGSVKVTWTSADEDATAFFVERAEVEAGPWSRLGQVDKKEFNDTSAEAGKTYWYSVVAIDPAGNASTRSNMLAAQLIDKTPPAQPSGLAGQQDKAVIKLTWKANAEKDLDGYIVERRSGEEWKQVGGLRTSAEFVDGSVRAGEKYSYRVTAYDKSGNASGASEIVEVEVKE
jgi:fibronectin type 3 domain-containing protein